MAQHRLYILMPVFNDWECLPVLLKRLDAAAAQIHQTPNIILMDDHSSPPLLNPGQFLEIQSLPHLGQIEIVRLIRNVGHQSAIAAGLCMMAERKDAARIVIMDADGEDSPSDLPDLLARADATHNDCIIFAGRRRRTETRLFLLLYAVYKRMLKFLTGQRISFGNYSVIPGPFVKTLTQYSDLWQHYPGTVLLSRIPYATVPCNRAPRIHGTSKMSFDKLIVHGLKSISLFADVAAVRILLICVALIPLALAALGAVVGLRVLAGFPVPDWAIPTAILIVATLFQPLFTSFVFAIVVLAFRRLEDYTARTNHTVLIEEIRIVTTDTPAL